MTELAGEKIVVALGMRYGNPSISSALRELKEAGSDTIVALPLYPQTTRACATTCLQKFDADFSEAYQGVEAPRVIRIDRYWDAPGYIDALAASIAQVWQRSLGSKLIVSFHSIPISHAQAGDPYPDQTRKTADALAQKLGIPTEDVLLTYQSRFDSRKWLGPMLEAGLTRLAHEHVKNVAVVCPGFSIDCMETLVEVKGSAARHFAQECAKAGNTGAQFTYVPALGANSALVETLAQLILKNAW